MGGEECAVDCLFSRAGGLPPRGRGRGDVAPVGLYDTGITPAWAGKSFILPCGKCIGWDYPRVGGEELMEAANFSINPGLPPRGRGRAPRTFARYTHPRITPAWAGKRFVDFCVPFRVWDYPRVGGEEVPVRCARFTISGLPPRGRGRDHRGAEERRREGITPAWAGKRARRGGAGTRAQDYPRVGGEESLTDIRVGTEPGLPPRGRGRGLDGFCCRCNRGITPAWAGKSCIPVAVCGLVWDYPRVGGEENHVSSSPSPAIGLPPRGRGRGTPSLRDPGAARITPAWAGKRLYRDY